VESNWVHSALEPLIGLLCYPQWLWWWRGWWNDWQGKSKYSEKTCPSAALSTRNPTCCPNANPGRRGGKPTTICYFFPISFKYSHRPIVINIILMCSRTILGIGSIQGIFACIRWTVNIPIYGSTTFVDLVRFFGFLFYTQSRGLLRWGICLSQGRYLYIEQHKHRINAHRHARREWDSNPWCQSLNRRRWFMP
jgi:hypothetical protein